MKSVKCPICGLSTYVGPDGTLWRHAKAAKGTPGIATTPRSGQRACPGSGMPIGTSAPVKNAKGGTRLAKPTIVPEWGVTYYKGGEVYAEWFDTRAEAASRAEAIDASDVFVSRVVLHGSR